MKINTPLSEALGTDIPLLLAPMAGGPTTAELVSAVSNAGAFGQFGAAYLNGEKIRSSAKEIRTQTNKGFGVNVFIPEETPYTPDDLRAATSAISPHCKHLGIEEPQDVTQPMPGFEDQMAAVLESGVKLCSFHFGVPTQETIDSLKLVNILTAVSATSVDEAIKAETAGVDFIIAQGSEAGGHRGTWIGDWKNSMTGTLSLVGQLTEHTKTPIVAAGGIMDGRGMAAALALGAAGVQMGTAFLTCPEAGTHPGYKQALLESKSDTTTVTKTFSGRPARGLRNRYITEMEDTGAAILPFPFQNTLTNSLRKAAADANDTDFMSLWAGQAASLSRGLPAAQLIASVVAEYTKALEDAAQAVV